VRLVLGIGNPGNKYANNRHNVGFLFLDYLAGRFKSGFTESKKDYFYMEGRLEEFVFQLIKPTTYVNNSGIVVKDLQEKYSIEASDILVIYDDINIPFGSYRVRASGSSGGHNGISSIIYHLYSDQFPRIKVGIGEDFSKGEMAQYVLSDFSVEERKELNEIFEKAGYITEEFIKGGVRRMLDANSKLNSKQTKSDNQKNED
jgi:peptidyl-tRNA hydrolase, PTH1 family